MGKKHPTNLAPHCPGGACLRGRDLSHQKEPLGQTLCVWPRLRLGRGAGFRKEAGLEWSEQMFTGCVMFQEAATRSVRVAKGPPPRERAGKGPLLGSQLSGLTTTHTRLKTMVLIPSWGNVAFQALPPVNVTSNWCYSFPALPTVLLRVDVDSFSKHPPFR